MVFLFPEIALVQLYAVFKGLSNVVVKKIEAIGEVYVTLLIIGELIDSGTNSVVSVYANTVLVQT